MLVSRPAATFFIGTSLECLTTGAADAVAADPVLVCSTLGPPRSSILPLPAQLGLELNRDRFGAPAAGDGALAVSLL
jgi:hypothetical protein